MNKNLIWGLVIGGVIMLGAVVVFVLTKSSSPVPVISPTLSPVVVTPVPVEASPVASLAAEFTVTASNFKYDLKTIKVKMGDTVKIIFKNSEGFHDFNIDEFDVVTNQIGAEEEEEVEFVADKAGTFEYYCSVGTHRKMGMVGKLVVE
ncbi:MAG: cupredoxin domain-containing protein [Patescibacteria group bacterium]|mgnify:FL=1